MRRLPLWRFVCVADAKSFDYLLSSDWVSWAKKNSATHVTPILPVAFVSSVCKSFSIDAHDALLASMLNQRELFD